MTGVPHSAQAYAATYRQALADAEVLVVPLAAAQFNWKPAPDRWSVAECLDHLLRVGESYLPVLADAVAKAERTAPPPFRYGFAGRLFIRSMSPNSALKLPTAPAMMPTASSFEKEETLAAFRTLNERFVAICEDAEGRDLTRARVSSPFLKLLRFQVGALLEALAVHELRHLAQARRVTEAPGFPAA